NIDLDPLDYGALRTTLEAEARAQRRRRNARAARHGYSFDATIPALLGVFEQVRARYHARDPVVRRRGAAGAATGSAGGRSAVSAALRRAGRAAGSLRRRGADARLARRIRPV